jgi:hypothetical protein
MLRWSMHSARCNHVKLLAAEPAFIKALCTAIAGRAVGRGVSYAAGKKMAPGCQAGALVKVAMNISLMPADLLLIRKVLFTRIKNAPVIGPGQ